MTPFQVRELLGERVAFQEPGIHIECARGRALNLDILALPGVRMEPV
ncbi:MAG: hypothetical protein ACE5HC_17310 [Candidatus Binatia bacterium]